MHNLFCKFQVRGRSKGLHDSVLINCQYSMATFSINERKRRPRGDQKSIEMNAHLKQVLQACIKTELYPMSQIDVFVEVRILFVGIIILNYY